MYLRRGARLVKCYERDTSDDDIIKRFYEDMFSLLVEKQKMVINIHQPHSTVLLRKVAENTFMFPSNFVNDDAVKEHKEVANTTIKEMIGANIFHYNCNGLITWHGKVPQSKFSDIK